MRPFLACFVLAAAFVFVPACGDDGGSTPDAAPPDANPPDAFVIDAAPPPECNAYCDDMLTYCTSEAGTINIVDRTSCLTQCAGWPASVRTCRVEHASYAVDGAVHCQHAVGDETEINTPEECVLNGVRRQ